MARQRRLVSVAIAHSQCAGLYGSSTVRDQVSEPRQVRTLRAERHLYEERFVD